MARGFDRPLAVEMDEQRARGGAGATPTSLLHPCRAAVTARLSPSMEAVAQRVLSSLVVVL